MMNQKKTLSPSGREQKWLFDETMARMDAQYDEACGLLEDRAQGHGVRASSHYAVGLLARGTEADRKRAQTVLHAILSMQFESRPEDVFYGVFRRNDREEQPPCEPFPGTHFTAYSRYYLDKWQERIQELFGRSLGEEGYTAEEIRKIKRLYQRAALSTVPVIWKDFDPNWREFIGVDFALILQFFSEELDGELIREMDAAMERTVEGSLARYLDYVCPMNTNIELMHILICAFFGERWGRQDLISHAVEVGRSFEERYLEFHSVSEYNSTTYYSVDLMALSAMRQLDVAPELAEMAARLEAGIWEDIAVMYHPGLKNLSGPFSRGYETDMRLHSLIPALLYLGLGEEKQEKPGFNCELAGNLAVALLGTRIPEQVKGHLAAFSGERQVETRFRELMERGCPGDDSSVCVAEAFLAENYMLGALRGSRNTSGQLRSAAAFWKAPDGSVSNFVLLRREPGEKCEHVRTVYFNNRVRKNHMEIQVTWELERDMELFFAIAGCGLSEDMIAADCWRLPGMTVHVNADGRTPEVRRSTDGLEVVYPYRWRDVSARSMRFQLDFEPQAEKK